MPTVRHIARRLLPPVITDAVRRMRKSSSAMTAANGSSPLPPEWEYLPEDRPLPPVTDGGWDDPSILAEQVRKWPRIVELTTGSGPLGIAHEATEPTGDDLLAHNVIMSFGYVLTLASRNSDHLSMLDWGSGIGHYYLFARALLPEVALDYHGRDIPQLCRAGRDLVPEAEFHESDEPCLARRYDLVVVSGSLQYAEDWRATLERFAGVADRFIYLVVPVVRQVSAYRIIQRPYRYGYYAEFVSRVYNRNDIVEHLDRLGFRLRREFVNEPMAIIPGVPERGATTGFLFERTAT